MDELEQFKTQKPDIDQLRQHYPELSDLLRGKFADKPNVYDLEQGTVVSWELCQKKPKNPTYGRIPTGHFEFTAEYTEVVIVLEGVLETEVNDSIHTTGRLESITAPSGSLLKIDVREHPVLYICEYR